jgi:hypothetical protein
MDMLLLWVGRLSGIAGVLICGWAIYSRLTGTYYSAGFQTGTLLQAGIVVLLVACVSFLAFLTQRPRP